MASSRLSSSHVASRWRKYDGGIAVCDLPAPRRADAGTIRCPRHGHLLPCESCALRDHEASTAGWVIGALGLFVAILLALSMAPHGAASEGPGALAVTLTVLCLAGAITVGLLVAQSYGGEPIGVEIICPECGSHFVWPAAVPAAACSECGARMTVEQGHLVLSL